MTAMVLRISLLLISLSRLFGVELMMPWPRGIHPIALTAKAGRHSRLDLFIWATRRGNRGFFIQQKYYLSRSLEDDYLACHRTLALAEAYQVKYRLTHPLDISRSNWTSIKTPICCQVDLNYSSVRSAQKTAAIPTSMTIKYGEHVIYRDIAFFGNKEWVNWLNNCNKAREQAQANGGLVLVSLITWQFTVATP